MFENLSDPSKLEQYLDAYIIPWGINIIFALAIYYVGRLVIKALMSLMCKVLKRSKFDDILVKFIESIISSVLLLFVIVASLNQLGVDTTSLVALLGAAGLAIGFALKDSLSNFAAGVMLLIFRPFTRGEYVEIAGCEGVVENISILTTVVHTLDNKEVILPNAAVFGGTITNYSSLPSRRVDLVIGVSYEDDLKKAKQVMLDAMKNDPRILAEPAPQVAVCELNSSSVDFVVRPWCKSEDYWDVRFDTIEAVKIALDANDITIPFPQRDVHIYNESADT
jgi:small conductance mechanosensitive channel